MSYKRYMDVNNWYNPEIISGNCARVVIIKCSINGVDVTLSRSFSPPYSGDSKCSFSMTINEREVPKSHEFFKSTFFQTSYASCIFNKLYKIAKHNEDVLRLMKEKKEAEELFSMIE